MALPIWTVTTDTKYAALATKDANTVYFVTNADGTASIYKGSQVYGADRVKFVTSFEDVTTPSQGIVYIHKTTFEGRAWDGTAWNTIIQKISGTLDDSGTFTGPVSGEAIKTYVATKLSGLGATGNLTGVTYTAATGVLSFTVSGSETPVTVTIPVDNVVTSGTYDSANKNIVLTLKDSTTVTIPAADLVDVYTAAATSTVTTTVTGHEITANVKLSAAAGNALVANADGLYVSSTVDDTTKMDKLTAGDASKVVIVGSDGNAAASTVKVGGSTLGTDAEAASLLATEAALRAAIASFVDASNIVTTINADAPSATKIVSEQALVDALSWKTIA